VSTEKRAATSSDFEIVAFQLRAEKGYAVGEQDEFEPIRLPKRRLCAAWREHVQSRILDLDAELEGLQPKPDSELEPAWIAAKWRLRDTADIVGRVPSPWGAWTGVDVERAWVNVHSVEVTTIRLSEPPYLAGKLPDIIADAEQVLPGNDRRLTSLRNYQGQSELSVNDKESIAQIVTAVHSATANVYVRARSFRNILLATTFALILFGAGLGLLGALSPRSVNLCAPQPQPAVAAPQSQANATCPTARLVASGGDVFVVELFGLFSAALIGASTIRKMRGTSTPYAIPMASLLVKLPAGAMTAVGGLLLMRAGLLGPPVAASATPQVLAYALAFGASQQTFTRLIDRQAQSVLDDIPSVAGNGPAATPDSHRNDDSHGPGVMTSQH
jgi:hypothetical protein